MTTLAVPVQPWFEKVPSWFRLSALVGSAVVLANSRRGSVAYALGLGLFTTAILFSIYVQNWQRTHREGIEREASRDAMVASTVIVQSGLAAGVLVFNFFPVTALTAFLWTFLVWDYLQTGLYLLYLRRRS